MEAERLRGARELTVERALLVRHCESSGQAPDAPLTARGRAQAEPGGESGAEALARGLA